MKNEEIILIGGGGHCHSVIDVIEKEQRFTIAGIIDLEEKIGSQILGYPIIGNDKDLEHLACIFKNFHISLGFIKNPQKRIDIYNFLIKHNVILPVLVSPLAYVSKHAIIGAGTIIMHFAQINAKSVIGNNCIINSKALIEHNTSIGDNCHISTGAIINGNVNMGTECFIGSGAIIVNGVKVPPKSFIKATELYK